MSRSHPFFHPDEVYFPLYDREEIRNILKNRANLGFYEEVVDDKALERMVELASWACELRFGIYLMRMAGIDAEGKASKRIEVEDVENVYEGGAKVFLAKSIAALNSDEREF